MRVPRFYEPDLPVTPQDDIYSLSDGVVQHVSRALRMRPGEQVTLFNNSGNEYLCELVNVEKRSATVKVLNILDISRNSPLNVHIGQAISRGERMDYAVQKSTEMGMSSMTPLTSERCEVRLKEDRQEKRVQHWQQVAISACEQSLRNSVPHIAPVTSLNDWIQSVDAELKLVLHHHTEAPLQQMDKPGSVALLVGPEGGLSEEEVAMALEAGFKPLAIGPRVMRTETAPVAAQSIMHYLWGDLS